MEGVARITGMVEASSLNLLGENFEFLRQKPVIDMKNRGNYSSSGFSSEAGKKFHVMRSSKNLNGERISTN